MPHDRPSWWPANVEWPPRRRFRRSPFARRFGCLFPLVNLVATGIFIAILFLIARQLGLVNFPVDVLRWAVPAVILLVLFVLLAIGVIVIGVLVIRRAFSPLDNLLAAADSLAAGEYAVQVEERGPREVRTLARAFNHMAARLQQTDEQRRALLADATHELRNPLTIIRGNLEGMLDGVYPADPAHLRSLLEEVNVLDRLVEDLRTLSLAESGALQLKKEPTDLVRLGRETLDSFRARSDSVGVTLALAADDGLPLLLIDPDRMRQVLSNLVANALRYTPQGGTISLHYRLGGGQVLLAVQDTGPGIPAADLPHVFERFYKSADSGGMGLGLAIAKHLVEAHGGTIQAESTPGRGTTMRISLPAGAA